jgi:hypothetical protein
MLTPNYVIQLNDDYSVKNQSISKYVCHYYKKLKKSTLFKEDFEIQYGGGESIPCINKYFTSSGLRYMKKYEINPTEVYRYIHKMTSIQMGGSTRKKEKETQKLKQEEVVFKSDYTGTKKPDVRLVYLIHVLNKHMVVKITIYDEVFLTEKKIYQFFNQRTNQPFVNNEILRSYDTKDEVEEMLDSEVPHILLPCKINGKTQKILLSNKVIPENIQDMPFLTESQNGLYNLLKESSSNGKCSYIITEVKKDYITLDDYLEETGNINKKQLISILKLTDNLLYKLYKNYKFAHWDLHSDNLLVNATKSSAKICLFDFDWSQHQMKTKNIEDYRIYSLLNRYIRVEHDLYRSYHNMLNHNKLQKTQELTEIHELFVDFLEQDTYRQFNLDLHMSKKPSNYLAKVGRTYDLVRLIQTTHLTSIDFDVNKAQFSDLFDAIFLLSFPLMIENFSKFAYCGILFTDFILSVKKDAFE